MITLEQKLERLALMQKVADKVLPAGYKDEIKQVHIEDDNWHVQLKISMYDSDEYYKNIEPKYEVYCCDWLRPAGTKHTGPYGYIGVYETPHSVKRVTIEEARREYSN